MMKKMWVLVVLICCSAVMAVPNISFSTDGGGSWDYDGVDLFSFNQPVGIDHVLNYPTDTLLSSFIHIPDMTISNISNISVPGIGDVLTATLTPVEPPIIVIKDGDGDDVAIGTITSGTFYASGTTAGAYPSIDVDITISSLPNSVNSNFVINELVIGSQLDFSLSLQGSTDLTDMINDGATESSTFSGQMTLLPEPMTIALLGLGGLLIRRKKY